jgi:hypothetical protein
VYPIATIVSYIKAPPPVAPMNLSSERRLTGGLSVFGTDISPF